jgi:hypothetical protein
MNLKLIIIIIIITSTIFIGCSKDEEDTITPTAVPETTQTTPNIHYTTGSLSLTIGTDVFTPYDIDCYKSEVANFFRISCHFDQNGYERGGFMSFDVPAPAVPGTYNLLDCWWVLTPADQTATNQGQSIELTTINSTTAIGSFYVISDQGKDIYGSFNLTN